jgi:quercetin dioxygenase-like cupin family protein
MYSARQNSLVIPAGSGQFVDLGDHRGRLLVSADTTGGAFAMFRMDVDPDGEVPLHVHVREDETFHILSGRFEVVVGEQAAQIGPGDTIFAPPAVPHSWRCISPEGGSMIIMVTPGDSFEKYAVKLSEDRIVPSDPDGIARLIALSQRHGIEVLPPL